MCKNKALAKFDTHKNMLLIRTLFDVYEQRRIKANSTWSTNYPPSLVVTCVRVHNNNIPDAK